MRFYWLYDLSSFALCLVIIAFFIATFLVGLFLTRRWVRRLHQSDHSHNDLVGFFLAAMTVFDAVTLGLVAVGTWETYTDAQLRIDHEAAVLGALYRDADAYPGPLRTHLQEDLRLYYHQVVDVGWPQQQRGIVPNAASSALDQLQHNLVAFEPATEQQKIVAAETYRGFNELVEGRRTRLNSITMELPGPIWAMVIAGAILSIALTWFFYSESLKMHIWLGVMFSALVGLLIYLIAALDNPYRGHVSVTPEALVRVYEQVMTPDKK